MYLCICMYFYTFALLDTSSGICKQNEEKTGAAVTDQVMLDLWKYDNKAISSAKSDNKAIPSEIKREMRNL